MNEEIVTPKIPQSPSQPAGDSEGVVNKYCTKCIDLEAKYSTPSESLEEDSEVSE